MKLKLAALLLAVSNIAVAADSTLVKSVDNWQNVMNNKDAGALSSYYDEGSVVAQFPYSSDKNLVGLDSITGMFTNGPFNLNDLNVEVKTIALDENQDIGLLLKSWDIKFDKGGFNGLALEVMKQKQGKWIRQIDVGAGGLKSAFGFTAQDLEKDNSAFNDAIKSLKQAKRTNIDPAAAKLNLSDKGVELDNLVAIENQNTGLLITKISAAGKNYVTLNALEKGTSGWAIKSTLVASEK